MRKITKDSNRPKRPLSRPGTPGKPRPVTKGQNPYRANRQSVSRARVTSASNGKTKGTGSARVTTGKGVRRPELPKLPKNPTTTYTVRATGGNSSSAKVNRLSAQAAPRPKMKPPAKPPLRMGLGKLGLKAAIISEALTARNTADGTLTAARKRGDLNKKPSRKKKS